MAGFSCMLVCSLCISSGVIIAGHCFYVLFSEIFYLRNRVEALEKKQAINEVKR